MRPTTARLKNPSCYSVRASAPGSLMLLGEYAVLHGKPALVGAINKRISVTLSPRPDRILSLVSALGHYRTELSLIEPVEPFQFILTALLPWVKHLKTGLDVTIESEFLSTMGFSSSAAVTVAMLSALRALMKQPADTIQMIREGRRIIRSVQSGGSGADVAACVTGGLVAYRGAPLSVIKLPLLFPLTVLYSGSKTPTPAAMAYVKKKFLPHQALYRMLIQSIGMTAFSGIAAVKNNDLIRLGEMMTVQQGLMAALGVSTPHLNQLVDRLQATPGMLGAKISGSGLGDCVIGVGVESTTEPVIALSAEGIRLETIYDKNPSSL